MNSDFKKRAVEILLGAVLTAIIVLAAGYGYTVNVVEPLLAEGQAEARGGGVTRFTSDVQFQSSITVDDNITASGDLTLTDDLTADAATFATGLTVSAGTVALPASEIGAAEIANITRTVSIPLMGFIECTTDAGTAIGFDATADALPDYVNSSTNGLGFHLAFDDTGGTPDTAFVCAQVLIPADYASGGAVIAEITKDAETGANTEVLNCAGSINGAALGTAGTATLSGTAAAKYSCTPTLTSLAAGNSLGIELHITSAGTVDDIVQVLAVAFEYTATE
jgi:hypothetical protein